VDKLRSANQCAAIRRATKGVWKFASKRASSAGFTKELDLHKFLCVHRSILVGIAAVVEVQAIASGRAMCKNNTV